MKFKPHLIFLFFFTSLVFNANAQLKINVSNLEAIKGAIYIALYNSEDNFLLHEKALRKSIVPVESKSVEFTIKDLPEGEYAVTLFHDEDNNGNLTTLFGIPKEPYGFSNNAKGGIMGPPTYAEAKFNYLGKPQEISITLNRLL